jgi:hypothetical protein
VWMGGVPAGACPLWMRKFGGDTLSHIFRVERLLVVAAPSRDLFIQTKKLFVCAKHANKKHRCRSQGSAICQRGSRRRAMATGLGMLH